VVEDDAVYAIDDKGVHHLGPTSAAVEKARKLFDETKARAVEEFLRPR